VAGESCGDLCSGAGKGERFGGVASCDEAVEFEVFFGWR